MCTKILFFVATLCVVNASVITAHNYNDEIQRRDDIEDSPTFRSCNYQECDQRCRRLKFPGGACVNGRCKCDNFRTSEDFASLIEKYLSVRSCNPQECDQRCRRLKFPGGACVNDRCKCDNFLNAEGTFVVYSDNEKAEESDLTLFKNVEDDVQKLEDSENSPAVRSCNYQECDQFCRRLKFPGGACVNGRCKCDNFRSSKDFAALIEQIISLRTCYPLECEQRCRRLKFPGGACVNGHCKCDNFRNNEEDTHSLVDFEDSRSIQSCEYQECDQFCRRLKFPGGACVNGRCQCDNFRSSDDFGSLIENLRSLRSCDPQECDQRCRRLKFPGGVCVNGRCKCDNFLNAEGLPPADDTIAQVEQFKLNLDGDSEENEIVQHTVCYQYQCNDKCIRVGYAGGLCKKNKKCKCY